MSPLHATSCRLVQAGCSVQVRPPSVDRDVLRGPENRLRMLARSDPSASCTVLDSSPLSVMGLRDAFQVRPESSE